jgi:hypothetical protein
MGTRNGNRIGKLESDLFGKLTHSERFCMVISALAEGDTGQAHRIGQACPMKTYLMADSDYVDRLEEGHRLCKCATSIFAKYDFALRQIQSVKDFLCDKVVGMIASHSANLSVSAMLSGRDADSVDWVEVESAQEDARDFAKDMTARMVDVMSRGLRTRLQAEWAGFEIMCQDETGVDAWTLLKGYGTPPEFIARFEELLSSDATGDGQEPDEAMIAEWCQIWQVAIHAGRHHVR